MAPTAAAPLFIRASLIFSGMLGIQLDGLKDQNGRPITFQTSMPVNFTVPEVVMNQTVSENQTELSSHRLNSSRCIDCENNKDFISIHQFQIDAPTKSNSLTSSESITNGIAVLPPSADSSKSARNYMKKSCGPGYCSEGQVCVSWMEERNNGRQSERNYLHDSPLIVHECLPDDGIHWNKMSPSGAKLCGKGETHSIQVVSSTRDCEEISGKESCHVTWQYNCVNEKDSPHSCNLRKCTEGKCIEVKHCDQNHLCYIEAACTSGFPSPVHHGLAKKFGSSKNA